jgi:hypothetical protein
MEHIPREKIIIVVSHNKIGHKFVRARMRLGNIFFMVSSVTEQQAIVQFNLYLLSPFSSTYECAHDNK